jgi:hypothetical protein
MEVLKLEKRDVAFGRDFGLVRRYRFGRIGVIRDRAYIQLAIALINTINQPSTAIMVALSEILSFNAQINSSFPPGPAALFVGATSGIGAATLKAFAKYTVKPRAYFVGRSQEAADAIIAECRTLNPEGEYIFIAADVSLIKVVDEVCTQIQAREPYLNILFLSQGVARFDRPGNFPCPCLLADNIHNSYPLPGDPNRMID